MKKLLIIITLFSLTSCTENQRTRNFGGIQRININKREKVVTATWKQDDLWILTRPSKLNEKMDTLLFTENSSFGIWEGQLILQEHN